MKIDSNATGFLKMVLETKVTVTYYCEVDIKELGKHYVMWRNRKNVEELAKDDDNIPYQSELDKKNKLKKINYFKKMALKNKHTDTTLFGMRPNQESSIVIGDGVHRAIGIFKAYLKKKPIKNSINIRLLLIEGEHIALLDDYKLSINKSS